MWTIDYDNYTGANDESFVEVWSVTNGQRVFECYCDDDANWLCEILNRVGE